MSGQVKNNLGQVRNIPGQSRSSQEQVMSSQEHIRESQGEGSKVKKVLGQVRNRDVYSCKNLIFFLSSLFATCYFLPVIFQCS